MQNKGLVRILAVCLALVCAFYLSFSLVTSHYDKAAKEYAAGDAVKEYQYLDSIAAKKVWFGYTLKECREKEINLGLDLKGGMNVTMEVSVPDILDALSGHNETPNYKEALALAKQKQKSSGADFVSYNTLALLISQLIILSNERILHIFILRCKYLLDLKHS